MLDIIGGGIGRVPDGATRGDDGAGGLVAADQKEDDKVTTRQVVLEYLQSVKAKHGWEDFLHEDFQFTNYGHPVARANGKQALERIRRFYGMVNTMEIRSLIVEGVHACAFMWYELRSPDGATFESHIAEVFEVSGGKIRSFGIYFDSAPYPKPPNTAN